MPDSPDLIAAGQQAVEGHAPDELIGLVYERLRAIAQQQLGNERTGHSLAATDLVHEAYSRLIGPGHAPGSWRGQTPFLFAAGEAMRRILIEHARKRNAAKRGGGRIRLALSGVLDLAKEEDPAEILAFDRAFVRLLEQMPDAALVVRLRFYAGLSVEKTAEALGVSQRTVNREWTYARAFLAREIAQESALP